jgi:hypothetical protein
MREPEETALPLSLAQRLNGLIGGWSPNDPRVNTGVTLMACDDSDLTELARTVLQEPRRVRHMRDGDRDILV